MYHLTFSDSDVDIKAGIVPSFSSEFYSTDEWMWFTTKFTLVVNGQEIGRAVAGFTVQLDGTCVGYDVASIDNLMSRMRERNSNYLPLHVLDHFARAGGYKTLQEFALFFGLRSWYCYRSQALNYILSELRNIMEGYTDLMERLSAAQTFDELSETVRAFKVRRRDVILAKKGDDI